MRGAARVPVGPPSERGGRATWTTEQPLPMPPDMAPRDPMHHPDVTSTGDMPRAAGRKGGTRTRSGGHPGRPLAGALIWTLTAALALPVLRILVDSAVGPQLSVTGVISSVLLLLGLPIGAIGFYGLANGAARVFGPPPHLAWLRPPVAYIPVALLLFIAAGLAAS